MIKEKLLNFRHAPILRHANMRLIPVTHIPRTMTGAHEFNQIYRWCLSQSDYNTIVRTPSGGISTSRMAFNPPMWDCIEYSKHCVELTIIDIDGMWRIQFRPKVGKPDEKGKVSYAHHNFKRFVETLKEFNINLEDYAIDYESGKKAKAEIVSPPVQMYREIFADKIFTNVHHIDFCSSYATGLANTHPEMREALEYIYSKRYDDNGKWKDVFNHSIGMMQSTKIRLKYAHLARDAILDNNRRIEELTRKLEERDNVILLYNADGIWYCGDLYHDENEGKGLGCWRHDYIDCSKFRMRSAGAYEFICNGKYKVRLRGSTKLDINQPRSQWQWGDIYHPECIVIDFEFKEGIGVLKDGELI